MLKKRNRHNIYSPADCLIKNINCVQNRFIYLCILDFERVCYSNDQACLSFLFKEFIQKFSEIKILVNPTKRNIIRLDILSFFRKHTNEKSLIEF